MKNKILEALKAKQPVKLQIGNDNYEIGFYEDKPLIDCRRVRGGLMAPEVPLSLRGVASILKWIEEN